MHSLTKHLALLAAAVLACSAADAQPILYWADQATNKIQRLDLARPVIEDVVEGLLARPGNMALDIEMGHMYWSSTGRRMIVRANTDGSNLQNVQAGQLVLLDADARQMYVLLDTTLLRTSLDGTERQVLMELPALINCGYLYPCVAVDLESEKVYWNFSDHPPSEGIRRSSLDGSNQELFFDHGGGGLVIDTVAGKLYLDVGWGPHNFVSVDLDGTGTQSLDAHRWVQGIAVDSKNQKMYWTARTDPPFIRRSNLDGTDLEDLIPLEGEPSAIAFDAANDMLYWNSPYGVWRAELDGTGIEQLVTTNLADLHGIQLDRSAAHVYWTTGRIIGRHGLDGHGEEVLVEEPGPWIVDLDIDPQRGFLYWSLNKEGGTIRDSRGLPPDRIQRSRLDGSQIEDLIVSTESGMGPLELDVENDRLFWATGEGIQTANADGSEATQILPTPGHYAPQVVDLAVDASRDRVYWSRWYSHNGTPNSGWTTIDGSVTEVVAGVAASAIAFDPVNQHFYWSETKWDDQPEAYAGAIWRRSVAGDAEDELVASGLGFVSSLTIDLEGTSTDVVAEVVPSRFDLHQNYPNPFNPTTSIRYTLTSSERISLKVRDAIGRLVAVLVDEVRPEGTHQAIWDADRDQPSGVYFYTLEKESGAVTRSMTLLK